MTEKLYIIQVQFPNGPVEHTICDGYGDVILFTSDDADVFINKSPQDKAIMKKVPTVVRDRRLKL